MAKGNKITKTDKSLNSLERQLLNEDNIERTRRELRVLFLTYHLKNHKTTDYQAKYKYPHDFGGYVYQQYLPNSLKDRVYYNPKNNGYEKTVREIRKGKGKKYKLYR